ncbi:MAG TPA: alanine racemase [Gemmatimonadaceae bacterium]|nr:alanine racemase [Gemmatimonadaceae bacterium]
MTRQSRTALERAWVDIDLGALRQNAAAIARRAGVPIVPMIKADAYGLGAEAVARALEPLEPWGYGLATVAEGEALRAAGIDRPLLICTPLLPDEMPAAVDARLTPALGVADAIRAWIDCGGGAWHLAIDTGMNRAGVPWREVAALRALLVQSPPEGAFTHFHSSERNDRSIDVQEARFREALAALPARPRYLYTENSGALQRRGRSPWDLVRPGVALYGVSTGEHVAWTPQPVVAVRARIVELRTIHDGETVSYGAAYRAVGTRRIATLPLGYADGYRRALSNRGSALLHGRRVPVAGIVTMDMTMIDVTGVECAVGDVVTLVGRESGVGNRESKQPIPNPQSPIPELSIETVAWDAEQMSPYELLTGLRLRLPRRYLDSRFPIPDSRL